MCTADKNYLFLTTTSRSPRRDGRSFFVRRPGIRGVHARLAARSGHGRPEDQGGDRKCEKKGRRQKRRGQKVAASCCHTRDYVVVVVPSKKMLVHPAITVVEPGSFVWGGRGDRSRGESLAEGAGSSVWEKKM